MNYPYPPGCRPPEGGYGPPPSRAVLRRPIRRNSNIVCLGLLLMYFISDRAFPFVCGILFRLLGFPQSAAILQLCNLLNYLVSFGIPCLLMARLIGMPAYAVFPRKPLRISLVLPAALFCLGTSVVGVFCSSLIGFLLQSVFGVRSFMPELEMPREAAASLLFMVSLSIAPAVLEEVMFRGIIMQSLRRFGDSFALVTSAILFGMSHGNLVQGPNAVLMGLVIGYFVLCTGSLFTGIIIHFLNNALTLVIEIIAGQIGVAGSAMFNTAVLGAYLLLGIVGMIWLSAGHPSMFRVLPSRYPLGEGGKYFAFFSSAMAILYVLATVLIIRVYLR